MLQITWNIKNSNNFLKNHTQYSTLSDQSTQWCTAKQKVKKFNLEEKIQVTPVLSSPKLVFQSSSKELYLDWSKL